MWTHRAIRVAPLCSVIPSPVTVTDRLIIWSSLWSLLSTLVPFLSDCEFSCYVTGVNALISSATPDTSASSVLVLMHRFGNRQIENDPFTLLSVYMYLYECTSIYLCKCIYLRQEELDVFVCSPSSIPLSRALSLRQLDWKPAIPIGVMDAGGHHSPRSLVHACIQTVF